MGKGYLIDTNIVIGYLDNKMPEPAMQFLHKIVDDKPNISVITKIELLRFKTDDEVYKVLSEFVVESYVLELNEEIVSKTIAICRESRIKLPDGIIAATALVNNFIVLSRNTEDFKNITGLELLNPWEM